MAKNSTLSEQGLSPTPDQGVRSHMHATTETRQDQINKSGPIIEPDWSVVFFFFSFHEAEAPLKTRESSFSSFIPAQKMAE